MARIIMYSSYLKPYASKHKSSYIKYMGTRPGVQKNPTAWESLPATQNQIELIEQMVNDFGEGIKDCFEYDDFSKDKTMANASALISAAIDNNFSFIEKKENYIDYIANRPRVQKLYSHGLFSDADNINLDAVADEAGRLSNNMYISVFSLHREDAAKLGYDDTRMWRDMLRSQIPTIAHNYKIPLSDFRWYAAFHDERHHPHVHFVCWSVGKDGFLTEKGIENIKSALAHQIFAQDFEEIYEKKDVMRNEVSTKSKKILDRIINEIVNGNYENERMEELLLNLSMRIENTSGKRQYGYLPKDCKNIVDEVIKELSRNENLKKLYELWYEQKEAILKTYKKNLPERIDLYNNDEFKTIKNIVVREAQNLLKSGLVRTEKFLKIEIGKDDFYSSLVQDLLTNEPQTQSYPILEDHKANIVRNEENALYTSLVEELFIEETLVQTTGFNENYDDISFYNESCQLDSSVQTKEFNVKYTEEYKMARNYLYGNEKIIQDFKTAINLLEAEAKNGNVFAIYDVGSMYNRGLGVEIDPNEAQKWFEKALTGFLEVENKKENAFIEYRIGKMFSQGFGTEQNYESAFHYYELSSEKSSSFGQYGLGSAYFRGQGVEQDYEKAIKQFELSATNKKSPNSFAQYELGRIYENGIGTRPNAVRSYNWYKHALSAFEKSLQQNNDDMLQYRVGQMYLYGKGCNVDLEKAFLFINEAAEIKNPDAIYGLGQLYLNRAFSQYNPEKAIEYLNAAIKLDNQFAKYLLGKTYLVGEDVQKNVTEGLKLLESAAEDGNSQAEYLLGRTYLIGEDVPKDVDRAISYLQGAVESDNQFAKYLLGKTYLVGEDVQKNVTEGLKLLESAAEDGNSQAEYLLGQTYLIGEDVPKDVDRAISYLQGAVESDNQFAKYLLGKTYLVGEDVQKNVTEGLKLLESAAEDGNSQAEYLLGQTYLIGEDVPKDVDRAISYLQGAVESDNQFAKYLLGKTYLVGEDVQKNVTEGLKLLESAAEDGNSQAEYLLGQTYLIGEDVPKDVDRAILMLDRSVSKDNIMAQHLLGKTLMDGKYIYKDINRAIMLLTQASDRNYSPAKVTLALAYLNGEDVPKNMKLAIELFKQAAADGNVFAKNMLEEPDRTPIIKASVCNLLYHTSKIISSDIAHKSHSGTVDRKELIKIMKKKADEGIKYN